MHEQSVSAGVDFGYPEVSRGVRSGVNTDFENGDLFFIYFCFKTSGYYVIMRAVSG